MLKVVFILIVVLIILVGGFYILNDYVYTEKQGSSAEDYQDAEFVIDGQRVRLNDEVPDDAGETDGVMRTITRYFGNNAKGDLNGDGAPDLAFIVTQGGGGSGMFYYVVATIQNPDGTFSGMNGVYLGDRIAPMTTEISDGWLTVNYADRKSDEPMAATPSVGKSLYVRIVRGELVEVEKDFEGEADPSRMTLDMKTWNWISSLYNDGRDVKPNSAGAFTLAFDENAKKVTIGTDCNSGNASYAAEDAAISFGPIASTKKFCEGSQEGEFFALVSNTSGYHFTSRGELILDLKFDSGSSVFR